MGKLPGGIGTPHNEIPAKARGERDSWFIVFFSALDAVAGAADIQRNLAKVDRVSPPGLEVRASLHTGAADLPLRGYYEPTVNRAARLRSIAHGGQTILADGGSGKTRLAIRTAADLTGALSGGSGLRCSQTPRQHLRNPGQRPPREGE